MTDEQIFDLVIDERYRFIDSLDDLNADQWNQASLCEGWRVRDVIGHLVSSLEVPMWKWVVGIARHRSFDVQSDVLARRFGADDPADLVKRYRAKAQTRFAPPMMGPRAPLSDVVIHSRDVGRPLGPPTVVSEEAQRIVLGYLQSGEARGFVAKSLTKGLRFTATDLGLSLGDGPEVSGTGEAIIMALAGRPVSDELAGEGARAFRARLT